MKYDKSLGVGWEGRIRWQIHRFQGSSSFKLKIFPVPAFFTETLQNKGIMFIVKGKLKNVNSKCLIFNSSERV